MEDARSNPAKPSYDFRCIERRMGKHVILNRSAAAKRLKVDQLISYVQAVCLSVVHVEQARDRTWGMSHKPISCLTADRRG